MGNCLKTQLKESIQNDNLLKIGEMRFTATNDFSIRLCSYLNTTMTGKLLYGSLIVPEGVTEVNISTANSLQESTRITATAGSIISISSKYDIYMLNVNAITNSNIKFDISELYGCTHMKILNLNTNCSGDLFYFSQMKNLEYLYLTGCSIEGDIKNLINNSLLEVVISTTPNITGTFASLGQCPLIRNIGIGETQISGSIEAFVQAQRTLGNNTKSLSVFLTEFITFNGSAITPHNATLSWTADTITYDGVTINA